MEEVKDELFKIIFLIRNLGLSESLERLESFSYDSLTGLYNRRVLEKEQKGEFSLIFIDLDDFKEINDHLGYERGDEILKEFADLLVEHARAEDIFCRWGGDEFLLFLPNTGKEGAEELMGRIRKKMEDSFPLDCSFGVVESSKKEFSVLFKEASNLMKENKKKKKKGAD